MKTDCPQQENVTDFVLDEMPPHQRAAFAAHLESCPACREAVESHATLLGRLREAPPAETTIDHAPAVLARIRGEEEAARVVRPRRWLPLAAAAAAIAVLVALPWMLPSRKNQPDQAATPSQATAPNSSPEIDRALDWMCQIQEADGSWDAEKWGGNQGFKVALTALPVIALLEGGPPSPAREETTRRAVAWLRGQMKEDGSFGTENQGQPYNQSIGTLALLAWQRHHPDADLQASIQPALEFMLRRQIRDGGWGYLRSFKSDSSITEWHVEALAAAETLGWSQARPALERARAWMAGHPHATTNADEPPDSPSILLGREAGARSGLDLYKAYFLSASLRRQTDEESLRHLAAIRRDVLNHQVTDGPEAGSWPPDDQWGRAGGRLYSTALASLTLRDR